MAAGILEQLDKAVSGCIDREVAISVENWKLRAVLDHVAALEAAQQRYTQPELDGAKQRARLLALELERDELRAQLASAERLFQGSQLDVAAEKRRVAALEAENRDFRLNISSAVNEIDKWAENHHAPGYMASDLLRQLRPFLDGILTRRQTL